jgi:DNA-binding NtrC family response regulator
MRRAQVVLFEGDGRLAGLLQETAAAQGWWLREIRQPQSVLEALAAGGVLVLRLGRDLYEELGLVEQVRWCYPDLPVIVVGEAAQEPLAELLWDLGASLVLMPPMSPSCLPQVVASWLAAPPPAPFSEAE